MKILVSSGRKGSGGAPHASGRQLIDNTRLKDTRMQANTEKSTRDWEATAQGGGAANVGCCRCHMATACAAPPHCVIVVSFKLLYSGPGWPANIKMGMLEIKAVARNTLRAPSFTCRSQRGHAEHTGYSPSLIATFLEGGSHALQVTKPCKVHDSITSLLCHELMSGQSQLQLGTSARPPRKQVAAR